MKNIFTFLLSILSLASIAQIPNSNELDSYETSQLRQTQTIDFSDTVIFDLSSVVVGAGNIIDIPVSIKSDDIVNALDFWLKYDQTKLEYITINSLKAYLQVQHYYNPNDSTIRFTSNSVSSNYDYYPEKLVTIQFKILGSSINSGDFNSLVSLLNGDSCTPKLINKNLFNSSSTIQSKAGINIFPNPTNDILTINLKEKVSCQLFDLNGRLILSEILSENNNRINLASLSKGIYYISINNSKESYKEKIVLQ
jgi:hypothetical protein